MQKSEERRKIIKEGTITISTDWFIGFIERGESLFKEARERGLNGLSFVKESEKTATTSDSIELDIDISRIEWKRKGGQRASDQDSWAWGFGYSRGGDILDEAREIVQACQRYCTVITRGFEVKLSGRDGRLLNRWRRK